MSFIGFVVSIWKNQQALILMLLGLALAPLAKKLGVQLDPNLFYASLGLIAVQIWGHHYKDATVTAAKLAAGVIEQLPSPAPAAVKLIPPQVIT